MKKLLGIFVSAVLLVSISACSSESVQNSQQPENSPQNATTELTESDDALKEWDGIWNNFHSYFENPGLDEAYQTLADREGITALEVKSRYMDGKTYQCDIAALGIDGQAVTFYSKTQDAEASTEDILATMNYTYKGEETDDFDRTWSHFEADGDSPYPHLFLLPAEADGPGNTMMHFHFRYGSTVEELKGAEGWYATMIRCGSDIDLVIGHMTFED